MAVTKTKETKQERLAKAVAEAVSAGKVWHLPSVDFNDPNRPKTCLEVDFPILPINHVAAIEGNAAFFPHISFPFCSNFHAGEDHW
jgi:hypothetical protein